VLQRVPDPSGFNFWVQRLRDGATRAQVARGFWESAEHWGLEVDQYYRTFFHRSADPGGRSVWVNALLAGAREGDVVVSLLTSAEYTASHADTGSYVTGLYQDVLTRRANAAEVAFWQHALDSGSRSRADVGFALLSSLEADVQALDDYYAVFLGRGPDAVGQQGFLAAMASGQATPASVTAAFLGSEEYLARLLARC
jgi:hypothetical protein